METKKEQTSLTSYKDHEITIEFVRLNAPMVYIPLIGDEETGFKLIYTSNKNFIKSSTKNLRVVPFDADRHVVEYANGKNLYLAYFKYLDQQDAFMTKLIKDGIDNDKLAYLLIGTQIDKHKNINEYTVIKVKTLN